MRGREDEQTATGLSKSRVVAGWRCPRYLWWTVHNPEAPELQPSEADRDRMDQGKAVGRLATEQFPGGVEIEFSRDRLQEMVAETRAALDSGAPAIFEASFSEDGVFVAVDILQRLTNGFRLIEVKATNRAVGNHPIFPLWGHPGLRTDH